MTEDRFKVIEEKLKKLEFENNRLNGALGHLTEAFMILLEEEGPMVEEVLPPGTGFSSHPANN